MRVGSLFSGIGGIELGFERAGGFETAWFVEWDAYAQAVLKKHWPGVPVYGDVRSIDWSAVAPIDVLTGGFPCQPHSVAGKRRASADDRDLWPECRRAIAALRPKACVFENVPGLLTSEKGEFFKRIIDDFYHLGYRPRVYRLSARAVGAPHLRKRIFIVAYPASRGFEGSQSRDTCGCGATQEEGCEQTDRIKGCSVPTKDVAYPDARQCVEQDEELRARWKATHGSDWWAVEPDVGRVAYGVPSRVDRLKCLGNAVVPQVAEVIAGLVKQDIARGAE